MGVSFNAAKKLQTLRSAEFTTLEDAIHAHLLRKIAALNGTSAYGEDEIRSQAIIIRNGLVTEVQRRLDASSEGHVEPLQSELKKLQSFKASTCWYMDFILTKKMASFKPRGESVFVDQTLLSATRNDLRNSLEFLDLYDISNTDEVVVLFRALPSRSVNPRDRPTGQKLIKDRLTAVLTLFADVTRALLVVIGPSRIPASFRPLFFPELDLGIFYYSPKNSWNTHVLWSQQMDVFNRTSKN